ncbi:aldehyde dehydrogenase family protein [Rhizobium puerariae]|uniref:Aldehyde dehydrogenase family protein n=1 Tax=Rhizobium puerariae TaxID=1585791 RepID=A0ABV6AJB8_9HYPH
MLGRTEFYIDGRWVAPGGVGRIDVENPATEEIIGVVGEGVPSDVDAAVKAARAAFPSFSATSKSERLALLERIVSVFESRTHDIASVISREMGSPISFAYKAQACGPLDHFRTAIQTLQSYSFTHEIDGAEVVRESIGVCGFITAWNWPLSLIASKLAYALAAGCTVVLKPSEISPLSALMLAQVLHDAEVPAGVFNLVNGTGPVVGHAIASHPDIDMVSFTGSTRAGVLIAKAAADTVKRVHQELGGKSAHIVLPDADVAAAAHANVQRLFANAGQSCQAPTRMLVHSSRYEEALIHARNAAEQVKVGAPSDPDTFLGPVVSKTQFDRVQTLIESGISQGARLVTGGLGKPEGLSKGHFVRPTIFGDVDNSMTIAREEIFGPVLPIISYSSVDEAVAIANDTPYGLATYIQAETKAEARELAPRLRSGRVYLNSMGAHTRAPFGGYKQSGNGREQGEFGLEEYLEVKAIIS